MKSSWSGRLAEADVFATLSPISGTAAAFFVVHDSGDHREPGAAFVRIHRGRLVRREAVRRIEAAKSGDVTVTLASAAALRASRRYRERL